MRRLDWWGGILLLAGALLFHAVFPRYEWLVQQPSGTNPGGIARVDRWTGTLEGAVYGKTRWLIQGRD